MVRKLQPDIIINNRSGIAGGLRDARAAHSRRTDRAWEACMTMNGQLGLPTGRRRLEVPQDAWSRNLITCARDGGNYLLNIGPKAGRLDSRRIGAHSDARSENGWISNGGYHLHSGALPSEEVELCALHTQGEHALHARALSGRATTLAIGGLQSESEIARKPARRAAKRSKFDRRRFADAIHGPACRGAGRSGGHDHRDRVRFASRCKIR